MCNAYKMLSCVFSGKDGASCEVHRHYCSCPDVGSADGTILGVISLFKCAPHVVLTAPVQLTPARTAVDMRCTLEETLRSQTVVEFPTFHVLVVGTRANGNVTNGT